MKENVDVAKTAGATQNALADAIGKVNSVVRAQKITVAGSTKETEKVNDTMQGIMQGTTSFLTGFKSKMDAGMKTGKLKGMTDEIIAAARALDLLEKNWADIAKQKGLDFKDQVGGLNDLGKIVTAVIKKLRLMKEAFPQKGGTDWDAFGKIIEGTVTSLKKVGDASQKQVTHLKAQQAATLRAADATKNMRLEQDKLNERIGIAIGKLLRYRVAFFLIRGTMDEVRDSVKEFADIQNSFAQLQKVLRPVVDTMGDMKAQAFNFAQTYAKGVKEVIDVFTQWAQVGLRSNEIIKATQAALLASNATNVAATDVVEALTSAIFSYGMTASETTDIVNKWIAVQADFPVTAKDLMESLEAIGIVAKDFRVTIDELNGIVAGVGAVTRKTGKEIAQSLKTILARLPREETIQAFQDIGVAVLDAKGRFRPFLDIVEDLSGKWADLSEAQKKNIALTASGIRRYVDFTALIDNFATVQNAVATSLDSSGRAIFAAGTQLNTFQAVLDRTRATLSAVRNSIGGELIKPVQALLGAFNILGQALTSIGGVLTKAIAGFTAFVGILAIAITASKAYSFINVTIGKSLLGLDEKLIKRFGLMKLTVAMMNRLTAAELKNAAAQKVQMSVTKARILGMGALLKSFNLWVIALDAAFVALTLLMFRQKEYEGVADDTAVTSEEQARAIFSTVAALMTRQNELNKALKNRREALKSLIALEKQDSSDAVEEQKASQRNKLLQANQVLEKEKITTSQELARLQSLSFDEQLKAQKQLALGTVEQVNLLNSRINKEDSLFQRLKKNTDALEEQIGTLSRVRDSVTEVEKNSDQLFSEPNKKLEALVGRLNEAGLASEKFNLVPIKQLTPPSGLENLEPIDLAKKLNLSQLGSIISEAKSLFEDLESSYDTLGHNLDKELPEPIRKEFIATLQNSRLNAIATLESIEKAYSEFRKNLQSGIDPTKLTTDLNNLSGRINKLFLDVQRIPSINLDRVINGITESLGSLESESNILTLSDARAGAKALGYLADEVEGVIHTFEDFDFSVKFLKEFDHIVRGVISARKDIQEQLAFEGIEKDAKRTAQALQGFYLQQLKELQNLNSSLQGELVANQESLARAQSKEKRIAAEATGTEEKLNEEIRQIQGKINRLEFEQLKIQTDSVQVRKTLVALVTEELRTMAQLSKEEAARELRIRDVEDFYEKQAKFAQLVGTRQELVLRIERDRLKTIARMRVDQILQTKDTETQAKLVEELGGLMIDLRKNAREISLEQLAKESERIVSLIGDIQNSISSAVASIPSVIVAGMDKRFELTQQIKEAEVSLQEAVSEGNAQAVTEAKKRLKDLNKELHDTRALVFEIKEVGKTLIEGLGSSINKFVSEKFAQQVVELEFKGSTLGDQVARSLATALGGLNKQYLRDLEGMLAGRENAEMKNFESFVSNLSDSFTTSEGNFTALYGQEEVIFNKFIMNLEGVFEHGAQKIGEAIHGEPLSLNAEDFIAKGADNIQAAIEGADLGLVNSDVLGKLDAFKKDFGTELNSAAEKFQLDPRLLAAIVAAESGVNQFAVNKNKDANGNVVSRDIGFAQVNTKTADSLGVSASELTDAGVNLTLAAQILRESIDTVKGGDLKAAIAGYNMGPGRVNQAGGIEGVSKEVRKHNDRVLAYLAAQLKQDGTQLSEMDAVESAVVKAQFDNRSALAKVSTELRKEYGLIGKDTTSAISKVSEQIANQKPPDISRAADTSIPIVKGLRPLSDIYSENKSSTKEMGKISDQISKQKPPEIPTADDFSDPIIRGFDPLSDIYSESKATTSALKEVSDLISKQKPPDIPTAEETSSPVVESLSPLPDIYTESTVHTDMFRQMIELMAQKQEPSIPLARGGAAPGEDFGDVSTRLLKATKEYSADEVKAVRDSAENWGKVFGEGLDPVGQTLENQREEVKNANERMLAYLVSTEDAIGRLRVTYEKIGEEYIVSLDQNIQGSTTKLKDVLNAGFGVLVNALGAAIGASVGGGSQAAAAGGQLGSAAGMALGAKLGTLGGPIGAIAGSVLGGIIGGFFGGKKEMKEYVPSIQANTDALTQNTLAIEQLQKQVINAPSNFNLPGFIPAAQGPAVSIGSITVNGTGNANQIANLVIDRIQTQYERGLRTGTTRRNGF
jgi:TP901 family phage tail tape measure protein